MTDNQKMLIKALKLIPNINLDAIQLNDITLNDKVFQTKMKLSYDSAMFYTTIAKVLFAWYCHSIKIIDKILTQSINHYQQYYLSNPDPTKLTQFEIYFFATTHRNNQRIDLRHILSEYFTTSDLGVCNEPISQIAKWDDSQEGCQFWEAHNLSLTCIMNALTWKELTKIIYKNINSIKIYL